MAAAKRERAGPSAVPAERIEHLAGKFGQHSWIVLAVDHEAVASGTHAALDVRHRADGRPVLTELVHGNVVAEAFPDVVGGHSLAHDVSVVGGYMEEASRADGRVVDQGDVADRGADAGT